MRIAGMDALPDREVQSNISGQNGAQMLITARPSGRPSELPSWPRRRIARQNCMLPGRKFESSRPHHAFRRLRKFPVVVEKGPRMAGFLFDRWVSETADLSFGGRINV